MAHLTLVPGQDRTDHDEPPHEPTDDTRAMVIAGLLNEMPMESIAGVLGISRQALERHYASEIRHGTDRILIAGTRQLLFLAAQRTDLGVAHRATTQLLQLRLKAWREPGASPIPSQAEIDSMDLTQIEAEIDRLERAQRMDGEGRDR